MLARAGFTLGQLAMALGAKLDGDPDRVVRAVAPLESAGPDDVAFVIDARYRRAAEASGAGAFLVPEDFAALAAPLLRCTSPRRALIDLLMLFHPPPTIVPGVHRSAVVAADAVVDPTAEVGALSVVESRARIGARVRLQAQVYVGAGAEIGDESTLHPHVVVRHGVRLGRRVIVHAGAVIGTDGFGYTWDGGAHLKVPQVGGVVVEDDVEIGANATIDRATLGQTVIGRGTKIDNLVMVAHNVEIGEHCILAAQVGLAGSVRLGRGVVLLGQVGVADHVTIGDGAILAAQSGVSQEVAAGAKMFGTWARPWSEARRIWIAEGELPGLARRMKALERRLDALEERTETGQEADEH